MCEGAHEARERADCHRVLASYRPSESVGPRAVGWWGRTSERNVSVVDVLAWPVVLAAWVPVAWCLGWVLDMLGGGS